MMLTDIIDINSVKSLPFCQVKPQMTFTTNITIIKGKL